MKIVIAPNMRIGVWPLSEVSDADASMATALFLGDGDEFANWEYEGARVNVFIRIRCAGFIPSESIGVLDGDAIYEIRRIPNDSLYGMEWDDNVEKYKMPVAWPSGIVTWE